MRAWGPRNSFTSAWISPRTWPSSADLTLTTGVEGAFAAKQPSGPGATPPPAPSKPSADPKPAERPADPAAADDLKREPAQAGGASGGGGAGRTRGAVARKRYILVFEEKPKK